MDLLALLKAAHPGDTIKLPAGIYSDLGFDGLSFASPVTITSADPANPAILTHFNIGMSAPCSGLAFKGVDLQVTLPAFGAFNVYSSQRITFDGVRIYGPPGAPDANASALNFFDCQSVAVVNCDVSQVAHGVQMARSDHIAITGNHIHHVNSDGIDIGNCSIGLVSGNYIHDITPTEGNHPDCIQFTADTSDITVSDNLLARGGGDHPQGVFLGDGTHTKPVISGNLIVGTGASALRPISCKNVTITGNELLTVEGGDPTTLLVQNSDQVTALHNSAVSISITEANGNSNITQNGNALTVAVSQAEADAKVAAWLASHPGPWSAVAPVPAPVDPSAKYIAALKAVNALGTTANAKRAGPTKADMAGVLAVAKAALT